LASSLCGIMLNISGVKLQKQISASQMTIVNTLNKLVLIASCTILFSEEYSVRIFIGVFTSFLGCLVFSWDLFAQMLLKENEEERVPIAQIQSRGTF
jgi:drug/metabolite transporter (DMT)-like permease